METLLRNEMKNIQHIAPIDTRAVCRALVQNWGCFAQYEQRQNYPGGAHADTEMIPLRAPWPLTPKSVFESLEAADYAFLRESDAFTYLIDVGLPAEIAWYLGRSCTIARAMIVKLRPGGRIAPHIDQGKFADATERFHLPLMTNAYAWLDVDGQTEHLRADELYYFNKHKLHSGGNDGETARVHLIVDVMK